MHFKQCLAASLPILVSLSSASPVAPGSSRNATKIAKVADSTPRLILYHQTHRNKMKKDRHVSLLPLLNNTRLTHLYVGCYHFAEPGFTRLNDFESDHDHFQKLWREVAAFREKRPDVKFMAMLGGAAGGFFKRLTVNNLQEVRQVDGRY